jgi:two-component system, LytTR family, sensor kinase
MLFCDEHLEAEFLKAERKLKFYAIPIFTIITTFFITDYPFIFDTFFFYHLFCAFIGIVGLWFGIRQIIFLFRKYFPKGRDTLRLIIQILITGSLAVLLDYLFVKFNETYGYDKYVVCDIDGFDIKNFLIASLMFAIIINAVYEGFYLLMKVSHIALESERYKKESIEAQYQNLTSRLNPHFLFNSLNTLTTIVDENPKKAVSYIQELSIVYRYVLNSQKSTWVDIPSEMKFTQSYIELLKMRFEESLVVDVDICENHSQYYILPLTIQLLIENAVKHNEISSTHPLKIFVSCKRDFLVVSNNKQPRQIMPSSTKVGLHNINERYKFLVNQEVIVENEEKTFTVRVPLVKSVNENLPIS